MLTVWLLLLSSVEVAAAKQHSRPTAFLASRGNAKQQKIAAFGKGNFIIERHRQKALALQELSTTRRKFLLTATQEDKAITTTPEVWTMEELEEYALQEGIQLSISTLGPGFRTVARSTSNSSAILGYGEGFVRPSGEILHLDKMEVFKKMVDLAREENPKFRGGGTTFGVGLLFGYQLLLHGIEKGCTIAEFLAIDDEDYQHKRLVRYYSRAGFEIVKYVGDDIQDIPARMVWGGCGTLMRAKIEDLLPLWTQILNKSARK